MAVDHQPSTTDRTPQLREGFTLLELMVTLVILGFTAGMALMTYGRTIEASHAQTAIDDLRAIKAAEEVQQSRSGGYYSLGNLNGAGAINGALRVNITSGDYVYVVSCGACNGTTFTATATRDSRTITMNQAGTWGGTSPFVPTAQE